MTVDRQIRFRLQRERSEPPSPLTALDLFAGIGGLALGFRNSGFGVTGADIEEMSEEVFRINRIGEHVRCDLESDMLIRSVPVVVGGPPCRPWSPVNQKKRKGSHEDYKLLECFFDHVMQIRPRVFLMENVPAILSDSTYQRMLREMEWRGYATGQETLQYSDFGAATARRRLFTIGLRDSARWSTDDFFDRLDQYRSPGGTVQEAIGWLRDTPRGGVPDHHWSQLNTIDKYEERYRTGRFGWKKLEWGGSAPSFGSISKTYILHPDADRDEYHQRVLSVREVLSIMGFGRDFRFPEGAPLHKRYRMVANAVSPAVAEACARSIRDMLTERGAPDSRCEPSGDEVTAVPAAPERTEEQA